ncbi:MAG: hypothetical protein K1X92_02825, partial [Bacteroidia bacterium]|nr:hypothetical protein [Bacteroidia bacterium]
ITISGESGGSLMYFNGTDWVNLGIGIPGQILTISGGVPAWVSPPAAPTLGNLTSSTAGVTVTGGTGAVIGAGTTVNVATNALNQNGLVTGPTAANANQVWGTDPLGNPGWIMPVSNDWRLLGNTATNDPAVPVTYGTTAIGAGENYLGTGDAQDLVLATNATERFRVKQTTGFVGIGTATPATRLHGFRNDNANKAAILGQASQIGSGVTDFQNIGVQGYGQGLSAWGYGIGVAGLTDPATAWVGVGVYARFGSTIPAYTWIGTDLPDAALYADGDNSAPAAVFANGRVGVMNTLVNPVVNAMLDVNGDLALREGAAMNVAAGINNLAAPANEFSHYRLTGAAGAFSIASLGGGSNGQIVNLINTTNQTMTIVNGAAIRTGSGSNLVLGPQGSVSMIYNSTLAAWQVTSKSGEPDMNLAAYSQTTTLFGCATTLKTITITTAATDRVLLLGEADYLKTGSTAYFALGIYRNGVEIHEVAAYSPVNADNSLHTNWIDTPGAGTHTYTIRYTLGAGTASFYGSNLMGYIIK